MARRYLSLLVLIAAASCGDNKQPAAPGPACSDGIDNDGDGFVDFPDDLGCTSAIDDTEDSGPSPKCSDGRDNDGDGLIDFPDDPGCLVPQSDDEADDCPDGPNCPQCANGKDDDGNGSMDYPNDPGCMSASDPFELVEDPVACGAGLVIKHIPPSGVDTGMLDTSSHSNLVTTCGGGGGASAFAYLLNLVSPKIVIATTDGSAVDTVLDLRSSDCSNPTASLMCADDISDTNRASAITTTLAPGTYFIIVEGHDTSVSGAYMLSVTLFTPEGDECTTTPECAPGLVCRVPTGGTNMICTKPECSDGVENDTDGKIDFPNDPGCDGPDDNSEADDCPSGPNCPACSNGLDDDSDGKIDFPLDTSCSAAAGNVEGCNAEQDPILPVSGPSQTSTLVGLHDDHAPSCSFGGGGNDQLFILTVPQMATLDIDTNDSLIDTVLSLLPAATCAEPSIACDDDGGLPNVQSALSFTNFAAGTYIIAVDGFDGNELGPFNLHVTGTIAPGGSCASQLFASGAIKCPVGMACTGGTCN